MKSATTIKLITILSLLSACLACGSGDDEVDSRDIDLEDIGLEITTLMTSSEQVQIAVELTDSQGRHVNLTGGDSLLAVFQTEQTQLVQKTAESIVYYEAEIQINSQTDLPITLILERQQGSIEVDIEQYSPPAFTIISPLGELALLSTDELDIAWSPSGVGQFMDLTSMLRCTLRDQNNQELIREIFLENVLVDSGEEDYEIEEIVQLFRLQEEVANRQIVESEPCQLQLTLTRKQSTNQSHPTFGHVWLESRYVQLSELVSVSLE